MRNSREFVMLAYPYNPLKHYVTGAFVSEKLDGVRAIWIPSTIGVQVDKVPFANLQKDATSNAKRPASGLWSRYGNPIWCPDSWSAQLPGNFMLDGELYCGLGQFQQTTSTVKKKEGVEHEWSNITYRVFDNPKMTQLFTPGKIHNGSWKHFEFPSLVGHEWLLDGLHGDRLIHSFEKNHFLLQKLVPENNVVKLHPQTRLSFTTDAAEKQLDELAAAVVAKGGEGVIVRMAESYWEPVRSHGLLKVKPSLDAEAKVVGWEPGKGRLAGYMGSLTVEWRNPMLALKRFQIGTGFDDAERIVSNGQPKLFPMGTTVTFKYRECTDDGYPKEARFWRVFEVV